MIRIRRFKEARNNFPLTESSVAEIKTLQRTIPREAYRGEVDQDEILEVFELLYEIEYKYHAIKNNKFYGVEQRRNNIITILEETGEDAAQFIADTFEQVFSEWLDNHALTDPDKWARQRYYDGADSMVDMYGYEETMGILMGELVRYTTQYNQSELITEVINLNPDVVDETFLDELVKDEYNNMIDELEDMGLVYANSRFDKEFATEEEAREFIDDNLSAFDNDYFNYHGSKEAALEHLIEFLEDTGFFDNTENVENFLDLDEFFMTAYKEIVFPAWYDYWSGMGIDETRDNVEDVYKQLTNIEKLPIEKQFMVINIAKNTNHQNGSMMEYYEEMWSVDYVALERLSSMDVTEWEEELREIGVELR